MELYCLPTICSVVPILFLALIVSAPAVLPAFRKLAHRSPAFSVSFALLLGLFSFFLVHIAITTMYMLFSLYMHEFLLSYQGQSLFRSEQPFLIELWMQWVIPLGEDPPCYLGDSSVCNLLRQAYSGSMGAALWPEQTPGIALGVLAGILTGFIGMRLLRGKRF